MSEEFMGGVASETRRRRRRRRRRKGGGSTGAEDTTQETGFGEDGFDSDELLTSDDEDEDEGGGRSEPAEEEEAAPRRRGERPVIRTRGTASSAVRPSRREPPAAPARPAGPVIHHRGRPGQRMERVTPDASRPEPVVGREAPRGRPSERTDGRGGRDGGRDSREGREPREARESRDTRESRESRDSTREDGPRRRTMESSEAAVNTPASGKNPYRKRSSRPKRVAPGSAATRRRKLNKLEVQGLTDWLGKLPEHLLANLYKGLGGQPKKAGGEERMIQLAVRAIAQGNRLGALVKAFGDRERNAMATLLQCGGLAHAEEFHRELIATYGGHDREWKKAMIQLSERGVVMASEEHDAQFFYAVPDILVDGLAEELSQEMALPTFAHEGMRVIDHRPFCPPLDFSITTVGTYISQRSIRLSQRHDIYKVDQEEMDAFFSQIWEPESELFAFHLDFLMMHGLVRLTGDYLTLDREVMEEWLQLEPEDQRDLIFRALERRFEMAEWVLWAVHAAGGEGANNDWVAERPLSALYRHWKRGKDWRERFKSGRWGATRTSERDSWSFSALVRCGLLELGQWGQEKFYRLTERAMALLEPSEDEGFRQFYLTPSFEMMAPAGLSPVILFRMGELAELTGVDRANTFKITESNIASALENGWRRDDVLQFLRDNSQIGLPDNVEATLKGWIGHRGDVEFHQLTLITIHRSQIRRFEGMKKVKPYLLHRFAPGMYAVDASRRGELEQVLVECGFSPAKDTRGFGAQTAADARQSLHRLLAEAREAVLDPAKVQGAIEPGQLFAVPGSRTASAAPEPELPPQVTVAEVRQILDQALSRDGRVEMIYLAKTGERLACRVHPTRLAFKGDSPVLVGIDVDADENRTFVLDRIERLRLIEED